MAAITQWTAWPAADEDGDDARAVGGARTNGLGGASAPANRAARAVPAGATGGGAGRDRAGSHAAPLRRAPGARPRPRMVARPEVALFAGDGRLATHRLPARSTPLVAHDDLAGLDRRRRLVSVPTAPPRRNPPRRTVTPAVYRRRRAVVAALFLGVLLATSWGALSVLGGGSLTASEAGSPSAATTELRLQPVSRTTYVVQPGDTLWAIARRLAPEGGDVRPIVDALAADRGGRALEVGERIVLP